MTIAPHTFLIFHARHARPPKAKYCHVTFPNDPEHRTYEYKVGHHELQVDDIVNVNVKKRPYKNELAKVVSLSNRRTYWRGRLKTVNFLAARGELNALWNRRFDR